MAEDVVRRRYRSGLSDFFHLYAPLADFWSLFDNQGSAGPWMVAMKPFGESVEVVDAEAWHAIEESVDDRS